MNVISAATLRRLIPAGAVGAVLAFSYIAQVPITVSGNDAGYHNNCGVKGTGYHDHGKVCPNRPFPGHGKGVLRILAGELPGGGEAVGHSKNGKSTGASTQNTPAEDVNTTSTSNDTIGSVTNRHGHGHDKNHVNSHKPT